MSKLLYIESSPRKSRSSSIEVAKIFLEEYKKTFPKDIIETIDLWKEDLPPFDGDVIDSKYAIMHGKNFTEVQKKAWKKVEDVIAQFKSADKYLFSLPMWNFGIPYKLKHYIDILVQPGYTFKSSAEGMEGLVKNKPVALVYARGGAYGSGSGSAELDLQTKYMETILRFIGFTNFQSIIIEPTLGLSSEEKQKMIEKAKEKAKKIASHFDQFAHA